MLFIMMSLCYSGVLLGASTPSNGLNCRHTRSNLVFPSCVLK